MAETRRALITFLDDHDHEPVDPSYGVPGFSGNRPSNELPGYGHISTLPVFPFDPTLVPGNDLPTPPVTTWPPRPGNKFVVKWLACKGLILVPDNELPQTPEPK